MQVAVPICTRSMRVVWFGLAATTVVSEVVRLPVMSPFVHYGLYGPGKMLCFFMLGYLTPLTFGRFNNLNRGILFAALSAALVEVLQGLIGNGHSFHVYELVFKLGIILFGFMMGLDARFEGEVGVGSFRVNLVKK